VEVAPAAPLVASASRVADFVELTKPRITALVLVNAAVGYAVGGGAALPSANFLLFLIGTALLCGGASALNQYLERDADARMTRTSRRPLPAGRVTPSDALAFGLTISAVGLVVLAGVNLLTLALGAASLLSYVLAYTPLKRVTSLCTVVGAVPGALPPLMGWAAARGSLGPAGWALFAILFLWQLPHFLAIGWLYREDYARGGFPMLAVRDGDGSSTGRQAALYSTALLPVTLAAGLLAAAGHAYLWGALVLGVVFLGCALAFLWKRSIGAARRLPAPGDTSMTPASTKTTPIICSRLIGSSRSSAPNPIVNIGPSEPTSDDVLAPMRLMDSAIIHVGSTVQKNAIASASSWIDCGAASARSGRVSTKCSEMNAVAASMAQAMKRDGPRRPMTPVAPTR